MTSIDYTIFDLSSIDKRDRWNRWNVTEMVNLGPRQTTVQFRSQTEVMGKLTQDEKCHASKS